LNRTPIAGKSLFVQLGFFYSQSDDLHNAAYNPVEAFAAAIQPYGVPNPFVDDDGTGEVRQHQAEEGQEEAEKPDPVNLAHAMIDAGFEPSVKGLQGETPLHLAAASGCAWCVSILMSFFGKVMVVDNNGLNPLHYAVRDDRPNIVVLLIHYSADPDARDLDGHAPIHYAAMKNSVDCIKALHSHSANLNNKNALGRTALHCAAELGHRDAVEDLLAKGADPNVRDIHGWAPLRLAIKGEFHDIATMLTDAGTRPY
jgi:ankyrin repeat protein